MLYSVRDVMCSGRSGGNFGGMWRRRLPGNVWRAGYPGCIYVGSDDPIRAQFGSSMLEIQHHEPHGSQR